jgi:hypothetical protein
MDTDLLKKGKRSYQDLKLVKTILSPLSVLMHDWRAFFTPFRSDQDQLAG